MLTRTVVFNDLTPAEVAEVVAHWKSDAQAEFIDQLAKMFYNFNKRLYGDRDGMQMLYIRDELTDRAREFIKKLCEYKDTKAW